MAIGLRRQTSVVVGVIVFLGHIVAGSASALAWGGEGHQVIAWIAEERLTEKAKAGVKELLGDAHLSDGEIANWADQVRRERRESAPWHYVNIPVDAKGSCCVPSNFM